MSDPPLVTYFWPAIRALLPYPDLLRRFRVRRAARKLVTCIPWPGDDATGAEAAQLALLRLLWLQRKVRRAARARRADEAAILARSAIETCLAGLFCLHSGDAVTSLKAANNRAAGRLAAYLIDEGLISQEAVDSAASALGAQGPDLNLRKVAEWLGREKGITIALDLYRAYYVPLSHFFVHANAFTLTRHVRPDSKLRRKPRRPWSRRSAVRMADGCTGHLAAAIAKESGIPPGLFTRYAAAHYDRMLAPAFTMATEGWHRAISLRDAYRIVTTVGQMRRYSGEAGLADQPAQRETLIRETFTSVLRAIVRDAPDEMFTQAIDELTRKVVEDMNRRTTEREPRHDEAEGSPDTPLT